MNYLLVMLTHGDNRRVFAPTLDAFLDRVTPTPTAVYVHCDGSESVPAVYDYAQSQRIHSLARDGDAFSWMIGGEADARGFCDATRTAWNDEAAHGSHDFVFWLEHDFVIERDVDLTRLGAVLQAEPTVAQMALMRDAVNEQEKTAGGLYESRRDQYVQHRGDVPRDGRPPAPVHWLEHRAYLTTNPSLMRRSFLQHNPWPDHAAECEGRFGIDLVLRGYSFGVWGAGRPWCRHTGERNGFGY